MQQGDPRGVIFQTQGELVWDAPRDPAGLPCGRASGTAKSVLQRKARNLLSQCWQP